jgi:hypothetical protein
VAKQDPPFEIADELGYLLDWFWDISTIRLMGVNGPNPLTLHDIEAWVRVTGNILLREEVMVLRRMDFAFMQAVAEKVDQPTDTGKVSERPMSSALFDALWK